MEVQVISHWQRRLKLLWSLWIIYLPHDAGRVVALIGNRIPGARVYLLQNVIAVWWGLFSLWQSKLLWPLAFFKPLLCSVYHKWFLQKAQRRTNFVSIRDCSRMQLTYVELVQPRGVTAGVTREGRAKLSHWMLAGVGFSLKRFLRTFIWFVGGQNEIERSNGVWPGC